MRTLVVFESMYGNTHAIADAIAEAFRSAGAVQVVPATEISSDQVAWADLVIAGGPTHARGLPTEATRASAQETAATPAEKQGWELKLELDPASEGPGIREWLATLPVGQGKRAAAFDTRVSAPAFITGRASKGIATELRRLGYDLVADAESFIIDTHNKLKPGELERARSWGTTLAARLEAATSR
jgi:hypothetical protein